MSVSTSSGSRNFIAIQTGFAPGPLSDCNGTPEKAEKRKITGITKPGRKWGAALNHTASGSGLNVPVHTIPLAWIARAPAYGPLNILSKAATNCSCTGAGSSARANALIKPIPIKMAMAGVTSSHLIGLTLFNSNIELHLWMDGAQHHIIPSSRKDNSYCLSNFLFSRIKFKLGIINKHVMDVLIIVFYCDLFSGFHLHRARVKSTALLHH